MLIARWAGASALALVVCASAGVRAEDEVASIHDVARAAVDEGRTVKSKQLGFTLGRAEFSETVARGGVLIGFDLGMRPSFDSETITAVRPIYRTTAGVATTRDYGSFVEKKKAEGKTTARDGIGRVLKVRAKAGYVATEVRMRTGLGIDAMSVVFTRVEGDRLVPADAYRTQWVGNVKGGSEGKVGEGTPIVGVFGSYDQRKERVSALGVISVAPAEARPKVAQKPPAVVSKPKPVEPPPKPVVKKQPPPPPPVAQEKPPVPAPAAQKPPAEPEKKSNRYADRVRGFQIDLPEGWGRLLYVEQQHVRRLAPKLIGEPEIAYRPAGAVPGLDTFILVQSRELEIGRTLDEIGKERTPAETFGPALPEMSDQVGPLPVGDVILDRARRRFFWKTTTETPLGRIVGLHVCHVGRHDTVTVSCHAPERAFAGLVLKFSRVNDSFQFDPAEMYREPVDSASVSLVSAIVFLLVSAAVFVPLAVIAAGKGKEAIQRRRRRQTPKQDEEVLDAVLVEEQPAPPSAFAPSAGIVTKLPAGSAPPRFAPPKPTPPERQPASREKHGPIICYLNGLGCRMYALPGEVYFLEGEGRRDRDEFTGDDLFAMVDGESSFAVRPEDVLKARIDAVSFWDLSADDSVGKLRLVHSGRGELTFDFRATEQMARAVERLPGSLGDILLVNAQFDPRSKKFVQTA